MLIFLFIVSAVQGQMKNQNESSDWDKVVAESKKGGYKLISPEEIEKEYLKDPVSLFLADTRQEWAYQMTHIKGAVYLSVTPAWWYQYSPFARSEMKKVLGPNKDKKVIFY